MNATDDTLAISDYGDANAVRAAIKAAAQTAAEGRPSSVGNRIQQATYDRFLCRVFSTVESSFILKGGTGMLARIPDARSTRDIDLASSTAESNTTVTELIELANVDLGDHFRFVFTRRTDQIGGENQPYLDGVTLRFDVYIGVARHGTLSIDLAAGHRPTAPVERRAPTNRLVLPRLRTYDYQLYPLADQIADKVCATVATYGVEEKPSSREKDLVDLVTIVLHEKVDARQLRVALASEMILRRLDPITEFHIPSTWGPAYTRLAQPIGFLRNHQTANKALSVVRAFLDPVLNGSVEEGDWQPSESRWVVRP